MQRSRLLYGLVLIPIGLGLGLGLSFGLEDGNENPYANIRIERKASYCFVIDAPQKAAQNLLPGRNIENIVQLGCSPAYPWTDVRLYGVETADGEHYVISADPNNRIRRVD